MDTKALFTQRFDAARSALAAGNDPAAAESLHWAIVAARSDPNLRRELASALFHLGKLSRKFGRAGEAEAGPLLTEALAISEELYGRENAALAPILNELSRLYLQQSRHSRAEEALDRLLVIARAKGEEHPDVASALAGLAFVKRKLSDDASAEALYRDALRIREKVLEPNHTVTIGTLEQLSETCAARGNFVEALALLHRALPAREAALGAGHERVHAIRSRVSKLELEIAIAADTAAAAAARAARDATPTPIWLKQVPDSPVDSPSIAAPRNSKELEFIGEPEPRVSRPVFRPRELATTPTFAAAVAASLMASPIQTPAASQIVIPPPETAHAFEGIAARESGAMHRDVVLAGMHSEIANGDVALDDRRSAMVFAHADANESSRGKRPPVFVYAAIAAVVIAIAGLVMLRPSAGGSGKDPVPAESAAAHTTTAAVPVATSPVAATVAMAGGAAAMVAVPRADSQHAASATSSRTTAVAQPGQHAPESGSPELRAPHVDVHVDPINMPTVPAALSVDSILRVASERQRASDSDRTGNNQVSILPATTEVGRPHTSPKIVGRAPDPGFPDALLRSGPREGLVVVRFMVDEFGRVDVASMTVERSDNDLFTSAVRDVLPKFRFEPAHTLGPDSKAVAAWGSVPFRFTTKRK